MPLSQGEIDGVTEGFLERAFEGTTALRDTAPMPHDPGAVAERIARGGFPEVVTAVAEAPGRLTKRPKIHLVDSGLATSILGWSAARLADPLWSAAGPIWESSVVTELRKQTSWLRPRPQVFHARDKGGRHEVDAVIEWPGGDVVGIEVKRSRSVRSTDAAGLRWLAQRCQGRMTAGVVLYGGAEVHALGDDVLAMPISALWSG